jgi:hypothetical protein
MRQRNAVLHLLTAGNGTQETLSPAAGESAC